MRSENGLLKNGQTFPTVRGQLLGGDGFAVPEDLDSDWSVLVFYRGHW